MQTTRRAGVTGRWGMAAGGFAVWMAACGSEDAEQLPAPLTEIRDAAPGECEAGGSRVVIGRDRDGDGTLDDDEIDDTRLECAVVPPPATLVRTGTEPPGAGCEFGGTRIETGPDRDRDGVLDDDEVEASSLVCSGADGTPGRTALVTTTDEPPGEDCADGGVRIDRGFDDDADGVLDPEEVVETTYACRVRGRDSLVEITEEPPGENCIAGGQRVDVGLDDDGDGVLDPEEITETNYVCARAPFFIFAEALPDAGRSLPYGVRLEAVGGTGGEYAWEVVTGALPPGLELAPDGTPFSSIAGVPTATGTYAFRVRVTDRVSQTVEKDLEIIVADPLRITTDELPVMSSGDAVSASLQAAGGSGSGYAWSVAAGRLPSGVTLSTGGALSGTPTEDYTGVVVVEVEDGAGDTAQRALQVVSPARWVAIQGTITDASASEVRVTNIEGASPTPDERVSPGLGVGAWSTWWPSFAPTGDAMAVRGQVAGSFQSRLHYVDLAGAAPAAPVEADPTLPPNTSVLTHGWTGDGQHLLYVAPTNGFRSELWSVDVSAGQPAAPLEVGPVLGPNDEARGLGPAASSPDGARVVFEVRRADPPGRELYVRDLGTTPSRPTRIAHGSSFVSDIRWTPTGRWLVYRARPPGSFGVEELYAVDPTVTSTPTRVTTGGTFNFAISPGGDRLVYAPAGELGLRFVELSNPAGPARTLAGDFAIGTLRWSPDGRLVAFRGTDVTTQTPGFWVIAVDSTSGEVPIRLGAAVPSDFAWLPTSDEVLYRTRDPIARVDDLRAVALARPAVETVLTSSVSTPCLSPDGRWLAYRLASGPDAGAAFVQRRGSTSAPTRVTDGHPGFGPLDFTRDSRALAFEDEVSPSTNPGSWTRAEWVRLDGVAPTAPEPLHREPVTGGGTNQIVSPPLRPDRATNGTCIF